MPFVPLVVYAALAAFEERGLSVTFLDVGQGDSVVVLLPDKRSLSSTREGPEGDGCLPCYEGIRNIDALVISHIRPDHSGGTAYLSKKFAAKEIWDNGRIVYPEEMEIKGRAQDFSKGGCDRG